MYFLIRNNNAFFRRKLKIECKSFGYTADCIYVPNKISSRISLFSSKNQEHLFEK